MDSESTSVRPQPVSAMRRMRPVLAGAVSLLALSIGGCAKISEMRASMSDVTGSTSRPAPAQPPQTEAEIQREVQLWSQRYARSPNDKRTARAFGQALRAARRHEQAVAVLQRAVIADPKDASMLAEYGKALVDAGRFQEAARVLERAQSPEQPDWTILSAQGTVADQLGNHAAAQEYYAQALKIAPNEPRILSNLGLSLALSKELPKAETVLRQAAAQSTSDHRVLQNLSLVLALQGKFDEAERLQRRVLPEKDAKANIAAIRQMIAQSNTWREISSDSSRGARS